LELLNSPVMRKKSCSVLWVTGIQRRHIQNVGTLPAPVSTLFPQGCSRRTMKHQTIALRVVWTLRMLYLQCGTNDQMPLHFYLDNARTSHGCYWVNTK
jgi:hypothetical protein